MSIDQPNHKQSPQVVRLPTIVFFGRRCEMSRLPLVRLLDRGITTSAIFIASPASFGPSVRKIINRPTIRFGISRTTPINRSIDSVAHEHDIPLYSLNRPHSDELEALLRVVLPDLIVASCFPWRLPAKIINVAPLGAINLHPSLLPKFRGPDPLFWALQTGTSDWGTTVHQVTERLDGGPIIAQAPFRIPDGIDGNKLETLVAELGGDLMADVVSDLFSGKTVAREQDDAESSYLSYPKDSDLVIDPEWGFRRIVNFVNGVIPLGYHPTVSTSRGIFEIRDVAVAHRDAGKTSEVWLAEDIVVIRLPDERIKIRLKAPVSPN